MANGKDTGKVAKASALTQWKYSFTDVPKYSSGKLINYSVSEDSVDGYVSKVDGLNITNTHEIEKLNLSVIKKWSDNNNKNSTRPEFITIHLKANGQELKRVMIKPNQNGEWSYEFSELPVNKDGKKIEYSVEEEQVDGYEKPKYEKNDSSTTITITNTITKTYSLPGTGGEGNVKYLLYGAIVIVISVTSLVYPFISRKMIG